MCYNLHVHYVPVTVHTTGSPSVLQCVHLVLACFCIFVLRLLSTILKYRCEYVMMVETSNSTADCRYSYTCILCSFLCYCLWNQGKTNIPADYICICCIQIHVYALIRSNQLAVALTFFNLSPQPVLILTI